MKGSLKTLLLGKCCHSWQKKSVYTSSWWVFGAAMGGRYPISDPLSLLGFLSLSLLRFISLFQVALEKKRKRIEIPSHLWKLRIRNIFLTFQEVGGSAGDKGLVYNHFMSRFWTHVGPQHLRLLRCCNTLWNSNINGTSIYAVYGLLNVCWEDWNVKYTHHGSTMTFSQQ